MSTILLVNGLTPLQTWGLIALVCFALAGVWSLLSLCLDWLNDWLNQRAYDAQYRANEEQQRLFIASAAGRARFRANEEAWTREQEKFKTGRRVQ